jgi:AbiV family abortive infection protein
MARRSKRAGHKGGSHFLITDQIAEGIHLCMKSAHDLYKGGVILDSQSVRELARALLILAIEEYGKIGWLYVALMLPERAEPEWAHFWNGFYSHELKNEIGRNMLVHESTGYLLPPQVHFFRHRFPFFTVSPTQLEREKQAMFYVDYDERTGGFVSPRSYFEITRDWTKPVWPINRINQMEEQKAPNRHLISEVETLVRYVARNAAANVFDRRVLAAYRELSGLVLDEQDRVYFLQLFCRMILRRPSGYTVDRPADELITNIKARHPEKVDSLVGRWMALGATLNGGAGAQS